ncbi:MAG TPA: PP2C family serine/threonine-protein phosphatase [Bryobacteraceae bacterium]|nr:PP2C family serine/threonine-protein phosphatase [Bryobacteraceae bacterium]
MKVRIRWAARPPEPDPAPASYFAKPETRAAEPAIIEKLMIDASGATDPGCVRSNNEDNYLLEPSLGLYIVADGMGGARAGEHASRIAVETVREVIAAADGNVGAATLVSAFEEANRRVMNKASDDPSMEGMGTTLVAALEMGGELLVASVGDSRGYLYENGALSPITEDQSWVNEVGRRLGLDEDSLKTHPMRHVLTMAIGVSDELRVNTYTLKPSAGAQVLLCSDGLHGVATEDTLKDTLASSEPLDAKCQTLIAAARARGGPDNITLVILKAL